MRLTQISPNDHITESVQELSIKTYLSESLYNTPEMQSHWKRIDENFVKGYETYLSEVALTPDQIQGIFTQASASGAGAAPKEPGKLAAIFDKVLPSSQAANLEKSLPEPNAGPVDGFENKAAAAVNGLQGVDGGTKQSLMQLVKAGIKKPETQQLILAAVGAGLGGLISKVGPFLSMIPGGGPVVSAITGAVVAGGVAVIAAKLRGEDWKSAFKGAIKPALMGGAAAVVGNLVTSGVSAMMSGGSNGAAAAGGEAPPDIQKGLAADQAFQDRILNKFPPDKGYTFNASGDSLQVLDANGTKVFTGDIPLKTMDMKTFADLTNNGQMATPGTTSGAAASDPKAGLTQSIANTNRPLSEGQVYLIINRICQTQLNEGPLDAIKGMFGKSKAAAPATAVTADALNAAWKQAGSPTDSDEIAAILKQAGVGDDVVGKVYTDLKIPAPGTKPAAPAIDIEQVKKMIAALPVDRKVRLLKFMQKNTAAAPAQG